MTTTADTAPGTATPDPAGIPADMLAALGGSVLAHSIAEYRERLRENGEPPALFNARI